MKLWIDDVRPAPDGYIHLHNTDEALRFIRENYSNISIISLDHDAGDYTIYGGDYINVLNELERLAHGATWGELYQNAFANYSFILHTANPVGAANMRRIIERNGWREVK